MNDCLRSVVRAALLIIGCAISTGLLAQAPEAEQRTSVDIVAIHEHAENRHLFRISDHELPAGWTTFRFTNASPVDHFFLAWRYPEEGIAAAEAAGASLLDFWYDRVALSFESFEQFLAEEITLEQFTENLLASLQSRAPWFLDPGASPAGGAGFIAPGATGLTTVYLKPGDYIVECYVRDENGLFHTAAGMLDHLVVLPAAERGTPPVANARVVISSTNGIEVEQAPQTGSNVIEVFFEDQTIYPHFLGHNVQLVRLPAGHDEQALARLARWMDWREPDGLVNRAPDGARFVGGAMEMTAGSTAFLHVELEPGDYAWIAEVPDPASHNMLIRFSLE